MHCYVQYETYTMFESPSHQPGTILAFSIVSETEKRENELSQLHTLHALMIWLESKREKGKEKSTIL